MKIVKNTRSQKSNTSRKADVVKVLRWKNGRPVVEERKISEVEKTRADEIDLRLTLSKAQFERLSVVAGMLRTTPEALAISQTLQSLDGWGSWEEFMNGVHEEISFYAEEPKEASDHELGERLEDTAPDRLKKLAGYVSPVLIEDKHGIKVLEMGNGEMGLSITGEPQKLLLALAKHRNMSPHALMVSLMEEAGARNGVRESLVPQLSKV